MAAALPLRASRPPPAAAAALHILRPVNQGAAMHLHPLGRRGPSSAPLKIQYQARPPRGDPFRSNCEKPADNLHEPEPEPEPEPEEKNHELVDKFYKRLRDAAAEMGVRETPNMFIKEKKQISTYMKNRTSSPGTLDIDDFVMANRLYNIAHHALDLASIVMDTASLRPGTTQFSGHTVDQMVRTYAAILCNVAENAYHKKFGMETFLSFLAALRCLVAIYHILVQDTVAKLKDGRLKNSITCHMSKHSQDFDKVVKRLEGEIVKIKPREAPWIVTDSLSDSVVFAQIYVTSLANCRETALGYIKD